MGNVRDRDHLGDPVVGWRIILRWIFREWDVGMDWIQLAQDVVDYGVVPRPLCLSDKRLDSNQSLSDKH